MEHFTNIEKALVYVRSTVGDVLSEDAVRRVCGDFNYRLRPGTFQKLTEPWDVLRKRELD